MDTPLAGLVVLDLSRLLPGGYCTLVLADLGAEVIKVEQPGKGDYSRWIPPLLPDGTGGMFAALNRGKKSVTLDLTTEAGRSAYCDLARTADVVVESFRPGVTDRLGVGYDVLAADNPGLVYAAITGYGTDGPYTGRAGHDINYLGYAGVLSISGHPAAGPWQPGVQVGDVGGGAMPAVVAILAALLARQRTGRGQFCDVSMTDGALSWMVVAAGMYAATGKPPRTGTGMLDGGLACYGVYRCGDGGYVTVGALEPQFWAALTEALGVPELTAGQLDPDRQPELRARLEERFASRSRDEWLAVLESIDACVGPVNDLPAAYADPQLRARGAVVEQVLADGSTFPSPGVVPRLRSTPGRAGGPPPGLGEHTEEVLARVGRSAADVAALRAAGVV